MLNIPGYRTPHHNECSRGWQNGGVTSLGYLQPEGDQGRAMPNQRAPQVIKYDSLQCVRFLSLYDKLLFICAIRILVASARGAALNAFYTRRLSSPHAPALNPCSDSCVVWCTTDDQHWAAVRGSCCYHRMTERSFWRCLSILLSP